MQETAPSAAPGEPVCAPGRAPNARAAAATAAAPKPFAAASADASGGATGATTAVSSPRPSISATTGTPTTLAGTVTSDTWRNWSHVTGAVASPHAVETPTIWARPCGVPWRTQVRATRGAIVKIPATAANESWKPASRTRYGFHASSTTAATSSACQRSRWRAVSQPSEVSPAAIAARMPDACAPTARRYAPTPASEPVSAA